MVGNYGVPDRSLRDEFGLHKHFESDRIHAAALLVQVTTVEYIPSRTRVPKPKKFVLNFQKSGANP